MKNRRNYYRILHVQPDAPLAVIKSSYNSLMLKLRQHPDLGGDHETAALINEAYAVLTHPARRAEYDRWLADRQSKASVGSGPLHRWADGHASPPPPPQDQSHAGGCRCRFCLAPQRGEPAPGDRCPHCESPLCPPTPLGLEDEDQRAVMRFASHGEVTVTPQHASRTLRATIRDLSATGLCMAAAEPLAANQVVRIDGPRLSAVARVVSCRRPTPPASQPSMIGVEFLTLEFTQTRGTFVSSLT